MTAMDMGSRAQTWQVRWMVRRGDQIQRYAQPVWAWSAAQARAAWQRWYNINRRAMDQAHGFVLAECEVRANGEQAE